MPRTPEEFLRHLRRGDAEAGGEQGSAAKWTHAAMALATRALVLAAADEAPVRTRATAPERPDPAAVLKMAERVIREGVGARGQGRRRHRPRRRPLPARGLARRGRPRPARPRADRLPAGRRLLPRRPLPPRPPHPRPAPARRGRRAGPQRSPAAICQGASTASSRRSSPPFPTRPRPPSSAPRRRSCASREGSRRRVALIADGIGSMHGVTHTIEQIRERGVPGFDVDVIGTDPGVDRRLPAAAELELPFYEGMTLGVPGLPDLVEALADGGYDLVHVTAPGPAGVAATLLGRITGVPLLASYHTELATYAGMRSGDGGVEAIAQAALGAFYGAPGVVLSPSPAADASLVGLGDRGGPDRALGARRRHRPLRPGQGRPRRLPGRGQGPLRRPADPREGRRPAGRELPARPRRRPAPAPAAGRRRPRGGRAARAPRRARRPSSAGSAARSWPAPTPAPTSSSSPAPPTPTAR